MKQASLILFTVLSFATPPVHCLVAEEDHEALIASLGHSDRQIREAAYNLLLDEGLDATSSLVAAVLDPANSRKRSASAAIVLVERLSLLTDRLNLADRTKPVINLTAEDREHLRPLVEYVRHGEGPGWRWYLAVAVLDEVDAAALLGTLPVLSRALYSDDPMLQYGAVKALYHNSHRQMAREAKAALLSLLYRPRPPFQAIYLRGNRLIEENRIAYTTDVRAYEDVDTTDAYLRRQRYYSHGDLLISETLWRLGAGYDEIGPRLSHMAAFDTPSTRLSAIRILVQLGPSGQRVAAANLRQMLLDGDEYLLRRLADERAALIGQVALDDPTEQKRLINVFAQLGEATKLIVAPLAGLLRNGDDRVRHVAASILGSVGEEDLSAALNSLRVALAMEAITPLTNASNKANTGEAARKILDEISRQGMVVSVDELQDISDDLVFDNPLRPSQVECFRAMLNAAVKLQAE